MRTLTALMLTAVIALPAMAQRPQRPGGGGMGFGPPTGVALLRSEDVQKDLKLSDEQKEKVKTYLAKQGEEMRSAFGGGGRPDQEKVAELRKKMQEENAKFQKDALTEEQNKRLKQIGYQVGGIAVFSTEDVAKELKITDEQKEKFKNIADQLRKDRQEVTGGGGGGGGGGRRPMISPDQQKKIDALVKEATEKAHDVLTADQKKTWESMIGAKFEGKIQQGFGGGRRPGAGG
jgi:Spy/CpxP family protein refolding chaperone